MREEYKNLLKENKFYTVLDVDSWLESMIEKCDDEEYKKHYRIVRSELRNHYVDIFRKGYEEGKIK